MNPLDIHFHYGPDGHAYVTRKQAAQIAGVNVRTIATWERRGHLARLAGSPPRGPLYRYDDVVEAEYATRQAAIRTSGSDTRTRRHFAA